MNIMNEYVVIIRCFTPCTAYLRRQTVPHGKWFHESWLQTLYTSHRYPGFAIWLTGKDCPVEIKYRNTGPVRNQSRFILKLRGWFARRFNRQEQRSELIGYDSNWEWAHIVGPCIRSTVAIIGRRRSLLITVYIFIISRNYMKLFSMYRCTVINAI